MKSKIGDVLRYMDGSIYIVREITPQGAVHFDTVLALEGGE